MSFLVLEVQLSGRALEVGPSVKTGFHSFLSCSGMKGVSCQAFSGPDSAVGR